MAYLDMPLDGFLTVRTALLALAGLAFMRAMFAIPWSPRAPALPPVDFPADAMTAWPRPDGRSDDALGRWNRLFVEQFRHPTRGSLGPRELPPAMLAAILVLGAAVARPDGPDPVTARRLAAAHRNPREPSAAEMPDMDTLEAIGDVSARHAWWECAAVELMARARAAGSWITPHDLRFLTAAEPGALAALTAGPGGTVALEGAGILAHHRAEKVTKFGIAEPHVEPAMAYLAQKLAEVDSR